MTTQLPDHWIFGDIEDTEQRKFYAHNVLSSVFTIIGVPDSFLDVGGGAGSWCAAAKNIGVKKVLLVDACPAKQIVPELTKDEHFQANLETGIPFGGRFDLVNCIEVIEHLTEEAGTRVIQQMTDSANLILFSAAIPGQGGYGHINERLHDHWHDKFKKYNFVKHDIIRPLLISDARIPFYLRQNLFLYAKSDTHAELSDIAEICEDIELIATDHLKALYRTDRIDLRTIVKALPNALIRSIRRRLGQ